MRPLHRPMFRYGGPIKEGVMSGIREPHAGGGRAALVGNPVYPRTGGREHHLKSLKDIPKFIKPGYWGGFVKPGTVGGKIKDWFKPKTMPDTVRYGLGRTRVPTKWEGVKNWYKTTPVGKYVAGSPEGKLTSYALGAGKGIIPKVVKGAATSPLGILSGAYMLDAFPGGQPLLNLDMLGNRNILGQRYDPKTDKRIKGTGISSLWEDEKVKIDVPDKTTETNPWKEKYQALLDEKKVPQKSDEEIRNERIQKYRDIMDIKGMNKEAAYDSLIAASQAINESGDFKGDLKSGKLINQIIQGASKAFDKPKKTKDAIDTLILKGEIEKDIKASDPSNAMLNELRLLQGKKIKEELNPSFTTLKAVHSKAGKKGQSGIDDAASEYATNNGVDFKGNIISKSDFSETLKDLKEKTGGLDEDVIITNWTNEIIKGKNTADGAYTVGDKIVIIKDSQVISVE